jgi:hypothetical protein
VSRPTSEGFDIDIAHCQDVARYKGYISNGKRTLKRIDINTGKIYWDALTLNIIPMKAQVTPDEEIVDQIW